MTVQFTDTLQSLVAGLGDPNRDKFASAGYVPNYLTDDQLQAAFKSASLPKRIVKMPVEDSIREGRDWQGDAKQITAIEAEEKRLGFWAKLMEARILARLWGGAGIYIGTGDKDPIEPLNPERIGKGGLKYMTVLSRRDVVADDLDTDPLSETYNKPKSYQLASATGSVKIHPSRLVVFVGAPHAEPSTAVGPNFGWGDSILEAVYTEVKQTDGTAANLASLVFEANVDVFGVPDLMSSLSDPEYEQRIIKRFMLAAANKGINKSLLRDKDEEFERKQVNFSGLPEVLNQFITLVSGAAEIPATRLFGKSPDGMNSTGDSDIKTYYDRISAEQKLIITPALFNLDECLIRSALGSRPPEVYYQWAPLYQLSEKEMAEIAKSNAETAKTLDEVGIFTKEELRKVVSNQMIESGFWPGLEDAMTESGEDWGKELGGEAEETGEPEGQEDPEQVSGQTTDATPRTLYVRRNVLNAKDLIAWAKAQGFKTTLPAPDLHVTIAFSREPVDWMKVGESWGSELKISEGGARIMEQFGEARVLLFSSSELRWRHESIIEAGASWDHPEYQPHITISYDPDAPDPSKIEPYQGEIILGPEIFEEVVEDRQADIKET